MSSICKAKIIQFFNKCLYIADISRELNKKVLDDENTFPEKLLS